MDVLEYWHPRIDWPRFKQGALADPMWRDFGQLVQLCHAHEHWAQATQEARLRPMSAPLYPESRHYRTKRRQQREGEIRGVERHMHRAAFLSCEKIAEMSYLLTKDDEGKPGWNLYWALRLAVRHQGSQAHARFKAAAFEAFDADAELSGDPVEIARRWLQAAGYEHAAA